MLEINSAENFYDVGNYGLLNSLLIVDSTEQCI